MYALKIYADDRKIGYGQVAAVFANDSTYWTGMEDIFYNHREELELELMREEIKDILIQEGICGLNNDMARAEIERIESGEWLNDGYFI